MNRTYELMFIVRPDMVEEDQDKLISTLETAVTSSGGLVKSVEKMGKRRLAYTVRRFHDGIYILLTVEGSGASTRSKRFGKPAARRWPRRRQRLRLAGNRRLQ